MTAERHGFLEMFYILDGSGHFHRENTTIACQAGDVCVAAPGVLHLFQDIVPITLYGVEISSDVLPCDEAAIRLLESSEPTVSRSLGQQVRSGLRRLIHEQPLSRPGSHAMAVGIALQLVAAVVREARPSARAFDCLESLVAQFVSDLEYRYFEPITLDVAAEEIGLSRRHLTRLFRKTTGVSFADYLEHLRLKHACSLLRETNRSITSIAFEIGFEDVSSFCRAFRRKIGEPPLKWRQHSSS
jgi:AraC family L-rhamnose operon regulatory protein RhaS